MAKYPRGHCGSQSALPIKKECNNGQTSCHPRSRGFNPCGSLAKYPVIPIRSEESVQLRDVETQCFASMNTTMLCFSKYTPSINRGQIPLQLSEPLIYVIK